MNTKTSLDILGIPRDASLEEAKRSYKRLVRKWHPDQYGNDPEKQRRAHDKLTEINVAYRDIVAFLKTETQKTTHVPEGEDLPLRRREKTPELKKKPSVFDRMASFFKTRESSTGESFRQAHDTPGGMRGQELDGRGQPASEFQKALKRAVRKQPVRTIGGKPQAGSRKGAGRTSRRPVTPGNFTPPKRCRGDRVEKIRPVRRVGKI
jgi:curved DNA-binding protein CbpA